MNYSVRNIVIAVGLAVCAVVAVLVYTASVQQHAEAQQAQTPVLVASRDIPAGTSGADIISHHWFVASKVVLRDKLPGALTTTAGLNNLSTRTDVFAGQQVPAAVFAETTNVRVPDRLHGNERAFSLPVDPDTGLVGVLQNNDTVDILGAVKVTSPDGTEHDVVRPLLRDILVLVAPASPKGGLGAGQTAHVVLRVTDLEANSLDWIKNFGTYTLIERPSSGGSTSSLGVSDVNSELTDGLNAKQIADLVKKHAITLK